MKVLEFLKEDNGNFSNARLLAFFAVVSFIMDWQMHLWSHTEFNPSWTTVAFVLGVVGLKVQQKFTETKNNVVTNTTVDAQ